MFWFVVVYLFKEWVGVMNGYFYVRVFFKGFYEGFIGFFVGVFYNLFKVFKGLMVVDIKYEVYYFYY